MTAPGRSATFDECSYRPQFEHAAGRHDGEGVARLHLEFESPRTVAAEL